MPVKIRNVIKAAFEADHFRCQLIFNQKPASLADADFHQKIIVSLLGHQLEISAKGSNTKVRNGRDILQGNVVPVV